MGIAPEDRDRIEDSLRGRPEDATRRKLLGQFKSLGHMPTSSETGSREFALAPTVATFEEREGASVEFVFDSDAGTVYAFNAVPLQAQAPPAAGDLAILHPVDPDRWAFRRGHQCNAKLTITVVKRSYQADNGAADGSRFRITMYKRASDGSDTGSAVIDTHTTDYTGHGYVCQMPNTTPWNAAQVPYAAPVGQLVVDVPEPGSYNLKVWDASGDTSKFYSTVKTFTGCFDASYCIYILTTEYRVKVVDLANRSCVAAGFTLAAPNPLSGATVELWNYPYGYTPPAGFPPTSLLDTKTTGADGFATFYVIAINEFNVAPGTGVHYIITMGSYNISPYIANYSTSGTLGYTVVGLCPAANPYAVGGVPGVAADKTIFCYPPQVSLTLYDTGTDQNGNTINLDDFWGDMAGKSYTLEPAGAAPGNPQLGLPPYFAYAGACQDNVQVFPPPANPSASVRVFCSYGVSVGPGGISGPGIGFGFAIYNVPGCVGNAPNSLSLDGKIDPCTHAGGAPPNSGKVLWYRYSTYEQIYEVGTWSL